jgi:hypothetical protein
MKKALIVASALALAANAYSINGHMIGKLSFSRYRSIAFTIIPVIY